MFCHAHQFYTCTHQKHCRYNTAFQPHQHEKDGQDHTPAPYPFFRLRTFRSKHQVVDKKLSKQKGDVMYFQCTHESFCLSKVDKTGHNRSDTLLDAVLGHFQHHYGSVCSAHAEEQIIDRSVLKQITHKDAINDSDRLIHDFLPCPADRCHLGKIRDPYVQADQKIYGHQEQVYRKISHSLFDL